MNAMPFRFIVLIVALASCVLSTAQDNSHKTRAKAGIAPAKSTGQPKFTKPQQARMKIDCPQTPLIPPGTSCSTGQTVTVFPDLRASVDQMFSGQLGTFGICHTKTILLSQPYVNWGDGQQDCNIVMGTVGTANGKVYGSHLYVDTGQKSISLKLTAQCYDPAMSPNHWFEASCGTGTVMVYDSAPLRSFVLSSSTVASGGVVQGTVTLRNRAGEVEVLVSVSSSNAGLTPGLGPDVLVSREADSTTFDIQAGSPGTVTIIVTSGGTSITRVLTIT